MALKTDIRGMVWKYPDTFVVGREQVRQYALGGQGRRPGDASTRPRPPNSATTPSSRRSPSPSIFARDDPAATSFRNVDVGLETMQIVQVDQRFIFHRPIKVGDALTGTMHVESVVERFGADIVVTRSVCANDDGEVVLEAFTTLMGHEGDNSISVKWDPETGQVDPHGGGRRRPKRISNSAPGPMYTRSSGFSQFSALSVGF